MLTGSEFSLIADTFRFIPEVNLLKLNCLLAFRIARILQERDAGGDPSTYSLLDLFSGTLATDVPKERLIPLLERTMSATINKGATPNRERDKFGNRAVRKEKPRLGSGAKWQLWSYSLTAVSREESGSGPHNSADRVAESRDRSDGCAHRKAPACSLAKRGSASRSR